MSAITDAIEFLRGLNPLEAKNATIEHLLLRLGDSEKEHALSQKRLAESEKRICSLAADLERLKAENEKARNAQDKPGDLEPDTERVLKFLEPMAGNYVPEREIAASLHMSEHKVKYHLGVLSEGEYIHRVLENLGYGGGCQPAAAQILQPGMAYLHRREKNG